MYRPLQISLSSSFKRFDKFSFFVVVLACNKIEKQLRRWNVSEHLFFRLSKIQDSEGAKNCEIDGNLKNIKY